jgi:hypothetical protein
VRQLDEALKTEKLWKLYIWEKYLSKMKLGAYLRISGILIIMSLFITALVLFKNEEDSTPFIWIPALVYFPLLIIWIIREINIILKIRFVFELKKVKNLIVFPLFFLVVFALYSLIIKSEPVLWVFSYSHIFLFIMLVASFVSRYGSIVINTVYIRYRKVTETFEITRIKWKDVIHFELSETECYIKSEKKEIKITLCDIQNKHIEAFLKEMIHKKEEISQQLSTPIINSA